MAPIPITPLTITSQRVITSKTSRYGLSDSDPQQDPLYLDQCECSRWVLVRSSVWMTLALSKLSVGVVICIQIVVGWRIGMLELIHSEETSSVLVALRGETGFGSSVIRIQIDSSPPLSVLRCEGSSGSRSDPSLIGITNRLVGCFTPSHF